MNTSVMEKEHKSLFNIIIETISGIFIPIINIIMGAALLKSALLLLTNAGILSKKDGVYLILFAIADGVFHFFPVLLAFTASKRLKADRFTSMVIAFSLVYPTITNLFTTGEGMKLFGLSIQPVTYPSSVIPILLAVGLQHYVEIPLEKYLPTVVKGFLKPMLTAMIVTPLTFLVFGPLGAMIGTALADAYGLLYGFSPILAGAIFGFLWQPMVIFGFHWGLVPVIISHINTQGVDTILPLLGPAVLGQAGAAVAVSLLAKNKKLKTVAMSGAITAILGVTEPVLFGVNIPLKRPMVAACIAGAIGGGIVGTSHARALSFAFPSFTTLVAYFGEGFWTFFIAMIIGFIIGFVLTLILRFKEEDFETESMDAPVEAVK